MDFIDITRDRTDDEDIFICEISDEALEKAADTEGDNAAKITWYYCPTGLTICRF